MLMLRGAGPAPFGARGLVLASQGGTCEVLLEREGFCNTGRFAKLRTMRSAVLPSAALLNLSRPPLARGPAAAAAAAAAASYGASLRAAGGGGGAPLGKVRVRVRARARARVRFRARVG